jgi:hypothetical protein
MSRQFETTSEKLELRWKITEQYSSPWTETFIPGPLGERKSEFGMPIKYDYQRILLDIDSSRPEKFVYPCLKWPKLKAHAHFTSCGQVSLTATFAVLSGFYSRRIRIFSDLYWETLDGLVAGGWKIDLRADIALIDSSLMENSLDEILAKCRGVKVLIVDTTCWIHDDPRVSKVIKFALKTKAKLFLCRSHLKLDSMGMEYGRLGSIVWSHVKSETPESLRMNQKLQQLLRLWGGYAQISQLYPFWQNKKFHAQNAKWVDRLRKANSAFAAEMADAKFNGLSFRKFDHDIFSWIECTNYSERMIRRETKFLMRALRFQGYQSHLVASYPWDFVALTFFSPKFQFARGRKPSFALRVSMPPLEPKQAVEVAQIFKRWMANAARTPSKN